MRSVCWFVLALLVGAVTVSAAARAQETGGYLGVDLQDVTKEEADKLGWEAPRGIKVVRPREDGPAAAAGILPDDIITSLDGQDVESMQGFIASIGDRRAGAQVRLRVLRSGKERTIAVMLARRPTDLAEMKQPQRRDLPILQLDTGGHMAVIKRVAFAPDGLQIVSAGDDKVIRIWDWRTGKTIRSIRGQAGPGNEGKIFGMALSPDGQWLAVGGFSAAFTGDNHAEVGAIRLYDFATGRLVALLRGHTDTLSELAFAQGARRSDQRGRFFA
jgi:WD40 repeat protein